MFPIESITRALDRKPWVAHLYVTDQCNLDCHYCNEYDNSVPHPPTTDLRRWMDKIRQLGVARLGLQGGEPLKHPDIAELVRYAKSLGFYRIVYRSGVRPPFQMTFDQRNRVRSYYERDVRLLSNRLNEDFDSTWFSDTEYSNHSAPLVRVPEGSNR